MALLVSTNTQHCVSIITAGTQNSSANPVNSLLLCLCRELPSPFQPREATDHPVVLPMVFLFQIYHISGIIPYINHYSWLKLAVCIQDYAFIWTSSLFLLFSRISFFVCTIVYPFPSWRLSWLFPVWVIMKKSVINMEIWTFCRTTHYHSS